MYLSKDFLKKINSDVLEKLDKIYSIPENSEIPQIQENKKIRQDDIDEEKADKEETEKKAKEDLDIIFTDFVKLLRLIEFQGDVLKNYYSDSSSELIDCNLGNISCSGFTL